jgi:hypothetical protein
MTGTTSTRITEPTTSVVNRGSAPIWAERASAMSFVSMDVSSVESSPFTVWAWVKEPVAAGVTAGT